MKAKKIIFGLVLCVSVSLYSFVDGDEGGGTVKNWDTVVCKRVHGDTIDLSSACNSPKTNGPCDRKTDCPSGYN